MRLRGLLLMVLLRLRKPLMVYLLKREQLPRN